jgi:hypothetical protein
LWNISGCINTVFEIRTPPHRLVQENAGAERNALLAVHSTAMVVSPMGVAKTPKRSSEKLGTIKFSYI